MDPVLPDSYDRRLSVLRIKDLPWAVTQLIYRKLVTIEFKAARRIQKVFRGLTPRLAMAFDRAFLRDEAQIADWGGRMYRKHVVKVQSLRELHYVLRTTSLGLEFFYVLHCTSERVKHLAQWLLYKRLAMY